MASGETTPIPTTTTAAPFQFQFHEASPLVDRVHWVILFVLMPIICILGFIGNFLSLTVLYKQGFKKSSNLILFALAASDMLFVIGTNAPTTIMYEWGNGFYYPEKDARILYCFYQLFDFLNWTAGPMSWWLPILITAERCIAVYFPLQFRTIVTTKRTLAAIFAMFLGAYVPQVYIRFWFTFKYELDPVRNESVGLVAYSNLYWKHSIHAYNFQWFYSFTAFYVIIIGSGCLAIVIRIGIAAAQRRRMMSGDGRRSGKSEGQNESRTQKTANAAPSRTTKTLLTLCIFYTISGAFVLLPSLDPGIAVWPLFTPAINYRSVEVFMYHLTKMDLCLNGSVNFVIYMAMNKNFRDLFLEIFGLNKKKK